MMPQVLRSNAICTALKWSRKPLPSYKTPLVTQFQRPENRNVANQRRWHTQNTKPRLSPSTASSNAVSRSGESAQPDFLDPKYFKDLLETNAAVSLGRWEDYHPVLLRDCCTCASCVDPFSKQKNFQTTDIPENIEPIAVEKTADGLTQLHWINDIPGWGRSHVTTLPADFEKKISSPVTVLDAHYHLKKRIYWDKNKIAKNFRYFNYEDYMKNDNALFSLLRILNIYGLVILRGVPDTEIAVADIASRIGTIRDTFYGRTWDVKSKPNAKNVAYTSKFLGLHMDLLYMTNPPGLQFLHCLKNTCEGGSSIFSDSWKAAAKDLSAKDQEILTQFEIPYHYENAGEHYYFRHPVIEMGLESGSKWDPADDAGIRQVNYSPPFQDMHHPRGQDTIESTLLFGEGLGALRKFAAAVESEENLFEYMLQEGECVIFNNRRVLHGRRQFDAGGGERWLRGTYVDTDVMMSRFRVLSEKSEDASHPAVYGEYVNNP